MKTRAKLLVGITSVLLVSYSFALANNGIQFSEFPNQEIIYLGDCIQEDAFADEWVYFRNHEFATPSGVFHSVLSYNFEATLTGLTTGRIWFAEFHASVNTNDGPGSTFNGIVKGVANPITGDGPKFLWTFYLKSTVTPDGNLVVLRNVDADNTVKCIGR